MRNALVAAFAMAALASAVRAAAVAVSAQPGDMSTPDMVKEFNDWVNSFIFPVSVFDWAQETMGSKAAHYFLCYVRNFLAGSMIYYITAGCWHW